MTAAYYRALDVPLLVRAKVAAERRKSRDRARAIRAKWAAMPKVEYAK